jgi:hypothetical protein
MKKDFYDMPGEWKAKIDAYIAWLETKYIEVIGNALDSIGARAVTKRVRQC